MPAIKPLQNFLLTAAPEFRLIGVQILLAMLPDVQQPLAVLKLLAHALGDPDSAVIEALRQGLLDYCQQVREDPLQDEIVLIMTKALTHPQASARQTALAVLTHFRLSDSLDDIIDRLGDPDLAVQDAAASAVAKICDDFRWCRRVPDYSLWKMKKYLNSFNPYVSGIVAQVFDDCNYEYE